MGSGVSGLGVWATKQKIFPRPQTLDPRPDVAYICARTAPSSGESMSRLLAAALMLITLLAAPLYADEIKIGHYGSLTGSEATFGQSTSNGLKLAIAEINAAGG